MAADERVESGARDARAHRSPSCRCTSGKERTRRSGGSRGRRGCCTARRGHVTWYPLEYPREYPWVGVLTPLSTPSCTGSPPQQPQETSRKPPGNFRSADLCTFPSAAPHAAASACRLGWRAGVSTGVGGLLSVARRKFRVGGFRRGRKFPKRDCSGPTVRRSPSIGTAAPSVDGRGVL